MKREERIQPLFNKYVSAGPRPVGYMVTKLCLRDALPITGKTRRVAYLEAEEGYEEFPDFRLSNDCILLVVSDYHLHHVSLSCRNVDASVLWAVRSALAVPA